MAEIGPQLQAARLARGLSVEEAAKATRIRPAYLLALEEDRYADLPAPVYTRGFLRNYATYLGLDAEELVSALEQHGNGHTLPKPHRALDPVAAPVWHGPNPLAIAGAVVLVLFVGFFAYLFHQYSLFTAASAANIFAPTPAPTAIAISAPAVTIPTVTPIPTLPPSPTPVPPKATPAPAAALTTAATAAAKPTETAATSTPAPSPSPKPTPTQSARLVVAMQFVRECWLRVTVDGKVVFEGTLQPGTSRSWDGSNFITVRAGNAGGVRVTFNGKQEGILGSPGEVVERTYRLG